MEDCELEQLLSEAELVVEKHRVKVQHSGLQIVSTSTPNALAVTGKISQLPVAGHSTVRKGANEDNNIVLSEIPLIKFNGLDKVDVKTDESIGFHEDLFTLKDSQRSSSELNYVRCTTIGQLNFSNEMQDGLNDVSSADSLNTSNVTISTSAGVINNSRTAADPSSRMSVVEELRELCWLLLSTASSALRDSARLHKQLEYHDQLLHADKPVNNGRLNVAVEWSSTAVSQQQLKVTQAATRIQHLLAQVCAVHQRNRESEEECLRLCGFLTTLLRQVSNILTAAGMHHLAHPPSISPRRTNVQRQVEAASSGLQALQEEVQRCRQLLKEQEQRVQQTQQHVREAEDRAQEAVDRLTSLAVEQRDGTRHHEQQLQQVYLQLARAEESLKQLQQELSSSTAANSEREVQQQGSIEQLRAALMLSQQRMQQSADATREIKAQFDHLQEESAARLEQLAVEAEACKQQRDQEQADRDAIERESRAGVMAARQQRDESLSTAALLKGERDSALQRATELKEQLHERVLMQVEIDKELLAIRDQISHTQKTHDLELKMLHDKLSAQGVSLCECQQQLRREQLTSVQLRTQVQLEQQRVHELRQHNAALLKQIDDLHKTLQDHLNRKVAEDVQEVLRSLNAATSPGADTSHRLSARDSASQGASHHLFAPDCASLAAAPSEFDPVSPHSSRAHCLPRQHRSHSLDANTSFHSYHLGSSVARVAHSTLSLHSASRMGDGHSSLASVNSDRNNADTKRRITPSPLDLTTHMMHLEDIERNMLRFAATDPDCVDKGQLEEKELCDDTRTAKPVDLSARTFDSSSGSRPRPWSREVLDLSSTSRFTSARRSVNLSDCPIIGQSYTPRSSYSTFSSTARQGTQDSSGPCQISGTAHHSASDRSGIMVSVFSPSLSPVRRSSGSTAASGQSRDSGYSCATSSKRTGAASSSGSEDMSELRRAREEARSERLEAARLREKCALLQVEAHSHKTALEDERARMKIKSRINRVKRGEFGQLLGNLEESVERCSLSPSSVRNLTQDNFHHQTASSAADARAVNCTAQSYASARSTSYVGSYTNLAGTNLSRSSSNPILNTTNAFSTGDGRVPRLDVSNSKKSSEDLLDVSLDVYCDANYTTSSSNYDDVVLHNSGGSVLLRCSDEVAQSANSCDDGANLTNGGDAHSRYDNDAGVDSQPTVVTTVLT